MQQLRINSIVPLGLAVLLVCFSVTTKTACAIQLDNLYEIELPAANRKAATKNELFNKAFVQILSKVSSRLNITDYPLCKQAVANAERYISKYSYRRYDDNLWLWVKFSAAMVRDLINKANLTVLGDNRPLILFWIALDTADGVSFVGSGVDDELVQQFTLSANKVGLPVAFPLLDITDQRQLGPLKYALVDNGIIRRASQRYRADVVLVGKLKSFFNSWDGQWRFLGDQPSNWHNIHGDDLNSHITQMIEYLTDYLLSRYVKSNIEDNEIFMLVENSNSIDHYAKVLDYLQGLSVIQRVELTDVGPLYLRLKLQAAGGRQVLQQALSLDTFLIKAAGTLDQPNDLYYRIGQR